MSKLKHYEDTIKRLGDATPFTTRPYADFSKGETLEYWRDVANRALDSLNLRMEYANEALK